MRNYQDEQNKNYENTKQMFEACRKDIGDSKKARRTMPIVDDEICFADIPENGVCITSQFENGLCGEIIWCRSEKMFICCTAVSVLQIILSGFRWTRKVTARHCI